MIQKNERKRGRENNSSLFEELLYMDGISKKIYLELPLPTEEENRSDQKRILDGLKQLGIEAYMPLKILRKLYPLCEDAEYKLTASLSWDGEGWVIAELEKGDTSRRHYGLAADLGSTTVVMRLIDCTTGECIREVSCYNRQIRFGTDILSRIFYCKDAPDKLEEIRQETIASLKECMKELEQSSGVQMQDCISMVIAGNTTMIHFLLGMDPFCVFYTPHALRADQPGFLKGEELGIPVKGYVYCYPSKSNYLGGDIISGMIATEIYKSKDINIFFDIGTNGELVIGNQEFLLCGAGAAGPALEGGVVKTGMRASKGAVDRVHIEKGQIYCHVIGEGKPEGICGSGIIDLLAEMFLCGWVDIRGNLVPEKNSRIQEKEGMLAVEYAPGLFFYQKDIQEFIRTKAAAHTMVEIMLRESGITMDQAANFYVAGAFGKHVSKESAIAIGMYPDMDRNRIINAGNSSLEGAQKLLLERSCLADIDRIIEEMVYIQFAAVDDFLNMMVAAQALPHTDYQRFPTVMEQLKKRQAIENQSGKEL